MVAAIFVAMWRRPFPGRPLPAWLYVLLPALLGWMVVSAQLNDLTPYRRLLHLALYVALAFFTAQGRFYVRSMAPGLATGLLVSAAAFYAGYGGEYEGRLTGLMADPNAAGYMLTVLGCIALGALEPGRWRNLVGAGVPGRRRPHLFTHLAARRPADPGVERDRPPPLYRAGGAAPDRHDLCGRTLPGEPEVDRSVRRPDRQRRPPVKRSWRRSSSRSSLRPGRQRPGHEQGRSPRQQLLLPQQLHRAAERGRPDRAGPAPAGRARRPGRPASGSAIDCATCGTKRRSSPRPSAPSTSARCCWSCRPHWPSAWPRSTPGRRAAWTSKQETRATVPRTVL